MSEMVKASEGVNIIEEENKEKINEEDDDFVIENDNIENNNINI
jgi:hypothetical protein